MGAHPGDPAHVIEDGGTRSLRDVIDAAPLSELGERSVAQFGERLPFLLKVLAAEEPLSLQAHPSAEQAREGFAREDAVGIPVDSAERNYRDASHKPELVVALTRFEALAGFRDPHRTVRFLQALEVEQLAPYVGLLAGQPDPDGLRALFTTWITLPSPALSALLPPVLDGCVRYLSRPDAAEAEFVPEARTALELSEGYPGDAGVLAALLLNRITLEPGQGLFLAAGNLHAYLHGTAVEIMANSDNVLRAGSHPQARGCAGTAAGARLRLRRRAVARAGSDRPARRGGLRDAGGRVRADPHRLGRVGRRFRGLRDDRAGRPADPAVHVGCGQARVRPALARSRAGGAAWISASDNEVHIQACADDTQIFRAGVGG